MVSRRITLSGATCWDITLSGAMRRMRGDEAADAKPVVSCFRRCVNTARERARARERERFPLLFYMVWQRNKLNTLQSPSYQAARCSGGGHTKVRGFTPGRCCEALFSQTHTVVKVGYWTCVQATGVPSPSPTIDETSQTARHNAERATSAESSREHAPRRATGARLRCGSSA